MLFVQEYGRKHVGKLAKGQGEGQSEGQGGLYSIVQERTHLLYYLLIDCIHPPLDDSANADWRTKDVMSSWICG